MHVNTKSRSARSLGEASLQWEKHLLHRIVMTSVSSLRLSGTDNRSEEIKWTWSREMYASKASRSSQNCFWKFLHASSRTDTMTRERSESKDTRSAHKSLDDKVLFLFLFHVPRGSYSKAPNTVDIRRCSASKTESRSDQCCICRRQSKISMFRSMTCRISSSRPFIVGCVILQSSGVIIHCHDKQHKFKINERHWHCRREKCPKKSSHRTLFWVILTFLFSRPLRLPQRRTMTATSGISALLSFIALF